MRLSCSYVVTTRTKIVIKTCTIMMICESILANLVRLLRMGESFVLNGIASEDVADDATESLSPSSPWSLLWREVPE